MSKPDVEFLCTGGDEIYVEGHTDAGAAWVREWWGDVCQVALGCHDALNAMASASKQGLQFYYVGPGRELEHNPRCDSMYEWLAEHGRTPRKVE